MRYAVSGQNTVAVSGGSGAATGIVQYVLGQAVTTGRIFWLRGMYYIPCATDIGLIISDGTAGDSASDVTIKARFSGVTVAGSPMGRGLVNFPAPGLKFTTGVVASLGSTGGTGPTGSAALPAGGIGGWGYEE